MNELNIFYAYINNKKVISSQIGPMKNTEGFLVSDSKDIATILNNYFSSVFTVEPPLSHNDALNIVEPTQTLNSFNIADNDILQSLIRLKRNKSPGPDQIYARTLKELNELLCLPFKHIFSLSLETGMIPDEWKHANVTPIFKKGCKSNAENYRPISLTSLLSKLLESIIRDKIVDFLEANNLINYSQFGFRNRRSCLTNLLDFFDKITEDYDEYRSVDI